METLSATHELTVPGKGGRARLSRTAAGWVVLAGSHVRASSAPSLAKAKPGVHQLREQALVAGTLTPAEGDTGVLRVCAPEGITLPSASAAASFVCGASRSGQEIKALSAPPAPAEQSQPAA